MLSVRTQYTIRAVWLWDTEVDVLWELLMALSVAPSISPHYIFDPGKIVRRDANDVAVLLVQLEELQDAIAFAKVEGVRDLRRCPKFGTWVFAERMEVDVPYCGECKLKGQLVTLANGRCRCVLIELTMTTGNKKRRSNADP